MCNSWTVNIDWERSKRETGMVQEEKKQHRFQSRRNWKEVRGPVVLTQLLQFANCSSQGLLRKWKYRKQTTFSLRAKEGSRNLPTNEYTRRIMTAPKIIDSTVPASGAIADPSHPCFGCRTGSRTKSLEFQALPSSWHVLAQLVSKAKMRIFEQQWKIIIRSPHWML